MNVCINGFPHYDCKCTIHTTQCDPIHTRTVHAPHHAGRVQPDSSSASPGWSASLHFDQNPATYSEVSCDGTGYDTTTFACGESGGARTYNDMMYTKSGHVCVHVYMRSLYMHASSSGCLREVTCLKRSHV